MTVQSKTAARPSSVTTGPIAGSRKIYTSPAGRPDINVPFREIALDPSAREEPYRAYDTSGPYTDPAVTIDLEAGLPPVRADWIAKRGFERIAARAVKDEDNGGASGDRLVPTCPAEHPILGGKPGQLVTQFEFARAGIVTEEMIYVAHRENLGAPRRWPAPPNASPTARTSAPPSPTSSRPNSSATRSRAAAPSFPPTSITRNSSRSSSAATSWSRSTPTSAIPRSPRVRPRKSRRWCGRSAGAATRSWTSRPAATSTTSAAGSCATRRCRSAPCRSTRRWRRSTAIPTSSTGKCSRTR